MLVDSAYCIFPPSVLVTMAEIAAAVTKDITKIYVTTWETFEKNNIMTKTKWFKDENDYAILLTAKPNSISRFCITITGDEPIPEYSNYPSNSLTMFQFIEMI